MAKNTTYDRSGQGNNGTLTPTGGLPKRVPGKIGQALDFDGIETDVDISQSSSLNNLDTLTISAWVQADSAGEGASGRIVEKTNAFIFDYHSNSNTRLTFGGARWTTDGYWRTPTDSFPPDGRWRHVLVTYDNSSTSNVPRMYINGIEQTVTELVAPVAPLVSETGTLRIGDSGTDDAWDGRIDDVRIYNRILSADEIRRLYKIGSTLVVNKSRADTLTDGLVGYWSFDGPDMSQSTNNVWAIDRSGQGNNGRLANTATSSVRVRGKIGQALDFDGVDDEVGVPQSSSLNNLTTLTLSAWVTADTTGGIGTGRIVVKSGAFSVPYMATDRIRFDAMRWTTDGVWRTNNNSFPPRTGWHHVLVTYDDSSTSNAPRIYFDGVEQSVELVITPVAPLVSETESIKIGSDGGDNDWDGNIDELRIYNRVLSEQEIRRLYQMGR